MSNFKSGECICPHRPKHHKSSGRCRGNCKCSAALKKAKRKKK